MTSIGLPSTNIDFVRRLHHLDFPECTHAALNYMVHSEITDVALQISRDFVLFSNFTASNKTLNNIQELQLLEILFDFFTSLPKSTRLTIFDVVFGGKPDDVKVSLFNKFTSLAISLESPPILECASTWIQHHGYQSRPAMDVAQHLITDFCVLYPGLNDSATSLPTHCPELAYHLMVVLGYVYECHDESSRPPTKLIQYVTSWLLNPSLPPVLCRLSQHSAVASPLPRLINWLVTRSSSQDIGHSPGLTIDSTADRMNVDETTISSSSSSLPYSRFHLALLHAVLACGDAATLVRMKDVQRLVDRIADLRLTSSAEDVTLVVERFAQILQVLLATGSFRCPKDDLSELLNRLPHNPLIDIILRHGTVTTQ